MRFYLRVSSVLQIPAAVPSRGCRERSGHPTRSVPTRSCPATPVPTGAPRLLLAPALPSLRLCPALPTPTQVAAPQGCPGGVSAAGLLRLLLLPAAPQPPARWEKGAPEPGAPVLPDQRGRWAASRPRGEQPAATGTSWFALGSGLAERCDVKSGRRRMTSREWSRDVAPSGRSCWRRDVLAMPKQSALGWEGRGESANLGVTALEAHSAVAT